MENILEYLENHYITFIILAVLMLFALVGYFAKKKSDKDQPYKLADENARAEEELENLAQRVQKGASLHDFVSRNVSMSPELQQVPAPQVNATTQAVQMQPVSENIVGEQAVVQQQAAPVQETVVIPTEPAQTVQNNVDSLI